MTKKVAIVGVEGSGKSVLLAGLMNLYSDAGSNGGLYLHAEEDEAGDYIDTLLKTMRGGQWPAATTTDSFKVVNLELCRAQNGRAPTNVGRITCLDFGGEVYRAAFGKIKRTDDNLNKQANELKRYIKDADDVVCLVYLNDIVERNVINNRRNSEAKWITANILNEVLKEGSRNGHVPRVAIALSQSDKFRHVFEACGGEKAVLKAYQQDLYNSYVFSNRVSVLSISSIDETRLVDDVQVPTDNFKSEGLRSLMNWLLEDSSYKQNVSSAPTTKDAYTQRVVSTPKVTEKPKEAQIQGATARVPERNQREEVRPQPTNASQAKVMYERGQNYEHGLGGLCESKMLASWWYLKAAKHGHGWALSNLKWMWSSWLFERRFREGPSALANYLIWIAFIAFVVWFTHIYFTRDLMPWEYFLHIGDEGVSEHVLIESPAEDGPAAQNDLGTKYYLGRGVERDYKQAFALYTKAAEQGYAKAQYNLGCMYIRGCGVEKNREAAFEWFQKAAEQGHKRAEETLARYEGRQEVQKTSK